MEGCQLVLVSDICSIRKFCKVEVEIILLQGLIALLTHLVFGTPTKIFYNHSQLCQVADLEDLLVTITFGDFSKKI
jgi:hypothetical protein